MWTISKKRNSSCMMENSYEEDIRDGRRIVWEVTVEKRTIELMTRAERKDKRRQMITNEMKTSEVK